MHAFWFRILLMGCLNSSEVREVRGAVGVEVKDDAGVGDGVAARVDGRTMDRRGERLRLRPSGAAS